VWKKGREMAEERKRVKLNRQWRVGGGGGGGGGKGGGGGGG